jgi:hypothetical protein
VNERVESRPRQRVRATCSRCYTRPMVAGWKAVLAQIEALPEPKQEKLVKLVEAEVRRLQGRARLLASEGVAPEVATSIDDLAAKHFDALGNLA